MNTARIKQLVPRLALGLALVAFAAGSVVGQPAQGQGNGEQARKEMREAQKRIRELKRQVGAARKRAIKNNPKLQEQWKDLRNLMKEKMRAEGHNPDKQLNRLKGLRDKLQGEKELSKQEKQKLHSEYQKKIQEFQKARKQAQQDPEVHKARDQLRRDMKAAMKKENPQIEEVIKELEKAQKAFRQKMQERLSNMKRGQGQGGGSSQGGAQ